MRPVDFAGFEATQDLQEIVAENEDDEVDQVSDIDSDEGKKTIQQYNSLFRKFGQFAGKIGGY